MLQVSPQKPLPLIWHGADPNDTDTLYVQAVVKDASTLAVLSTVNLTDNGSHLFSGSVTTPHDPSQTGTGRWIIVVYTVYTDSGYATPSLNYQRTTEQYLVKTLVDANISLGGGGSSIDYAMLKKLVGEVLDEKKTPIKFPAIPKIDLETLKRDLLNEVKSIVFKGIENIPKPERPQKVDLLPIHKGLGNLSTELKSRPKFEKTNLAPLIPEMRKLHENMARDTHKEYMDMMTAHTQKLNETLEKINDIMDSISEDNAKLKLLDGLKNGTINFETLGSHVQQKKKSYLESLKAKYM